MRSYFAAAQEVLDIANNTTVKVLNRALHVVRERKRSIMKYACPYCDRSFEKAVGLRTHVGRSHADKKATSASQPDNPVPEAPEVPPAAQEPAPAAEAPEAASPVVPEPEAAQEAPAASQEVPVPAVSAPPLLPRAPEVVDVSRPITVGSAIMLNGPTWWQDPGSMGWKASVADKLTVVVVSKEVVGNDIMLLCRADGGQALWAVQEKQVQDGRVKLIKLAPDVMGTAQAVRPPDGPREVKSPAYDYFEEERKRKEAETQREAERQSYSAALQNYTEARATRKSAEVRFEEVKKTTYSTLWDYIKKWGRPSAEGKEDFQVVEFGWKGHITRAVQPVVIKRDRTRIVKWLEDHGQTQALVHDINLAEWERLKLSGVVPPEFIRQVEVPEQEDDKFALRVDPA